MYILPEGKNNLQDYIDTFYILLYIYLFEKKKKEKILKGRNGILKSHSNDYSNLKNFQRITRGEKI